MFEECCAGFASSSLCVPAGIACHGAGRAGQQVPRAAVYFWKKLEGQWSKQVLCGMQAVPSFTAAQSSCGVLCNLSTERLRSSANSSLEDRVRFCKRGFPDQDGHWVSQIRIFNITDSQLFCFSWWMQVQLQKLPVVSLGTEFGTTCFQWQDEK